MKHCDNRIRPVYAFINSLLIPPDHPSRKRGDNYYLNRRVALFATHNATVVLFFYVCIVSAA